MNTIKIKKLTILNFKGIREMVIDFSDVTTIKGKNKSGKSTIFDAFTWLLFGKDSNNRSDFNIKTIDKDGVAIPSIEHTVIGEFDVNGVPLTLSKTYKEKWTKKRGSDKTEMTGHTTDYFVNDVPYAEKQFNDRVDQIIEENTFRLLTNPLYFNTMKWQEKRAILELMAGDINNDEIIKNHQELRELLDALTFKTVKEYQSEIAAKKKKLREHLDTIPARIDEVNTAKPEAFNYAEVEQNIAEQRDILAQLESESTSQKAIYNSKNAEVTAKMNRKLALQKELQNLKNANSVRNDAAASNIRATIKNHNEKIAGIKELIDFKTNRITAINEQTSKLEKDINLQREKWVALNAQQFVEVDHPTTCSTCLQALPAEIIENYKATALENFNRDKAGKLEIIKSEGLKKGTEYDESLKKSEALRDELPPLQDQLNQFNLIIGGLEKDLEAAINEVHPVDPREAELQAEIDAVVIDNVDPYIDTTSDRKKAVQETIDQYNKILNTRDQLTRLNARIVELEQEQADYSQQLSNLEKIEFDLSLFSKLKVDFIEGKINSKFKIVKFKMYNQLVNGGEEETCECTVDGVPYSDVNTAGKINAGLDIINALIEENQTSAPIWIDNCESINEVIKCNAQMVLLYVTKENLIIN